jgi:hypothetical protein
MTVALLLINIPTATAIPATSEGGTVQQIPTPLAIVLLIAMLPATILSVTVNWKVKPPHVSPTRWERLRDRGDVAKAQQLMKPRQHKAKPARAS